MISPHSNKLLVIQHLSILRSKSTLLSRENQILLLIYPVSLTLRKPSLDGYIILSADLH